MNVLGGLIERDTNKNLNGIPGFSEIPLARYLSSDNSKEVVDQEILIVLTPHIIRLPSISPDDLRTMAAGTDTNVVCTATMRRSASARSAIADLRSRARRPASATDAASATGGREPGGATAF